MTRHARRPLWTLLVFAGTACAGDGLVVGDQTQIWPRFQARVSIAAPPLTLGLAPSANNALHRMTLMGDYYPALPWLALGGHWQGGLRASGGVLPGRMGLHVPLASASGAALHASVDESPAGAESSNALWPYVGVGYTGLSRRSGWGFVADVGLVARMPAVELGLGRNASTPHGVDETLREIRLSPMIQVGVRYSF